MLKKSISLSDAAVNVIHKRKIKTEKMDKPQVVYSTGINSMLENYDMLMKENTPKLNTTEWSLIGKAYENQINNKMKLPLNIARDLLNYAGALSLDDIAKSNKTLVSLIKKVNGFSQVQQLSILDGLCCHISKQ